MPRAKCSLPDTSLRIEVVRVLACLDQISRDWKALSKAQVDLARSVLECKLIEGSDYARASVRFR